MPTTQTEAVCRVLGVDGRAELPRGGRRGPYAAARYPGLAPRLPGARVIAVESINADEGQEQSLRGFQFGELQEYLQAVDDVVVDIGASNVEELMRLMHRYRESHEEFDCFIVPTVPPPKQQQDIRPGLRVTHHRGRTVIAYAVDHDSRRVSILGVLYGGQDFERALAEDGDA